MNDSVIYPDVCLADFFLICHLFNNVQAKPDVRITLILIKPDKITLVEKRRYPAGQGALPQFLSFYNHMGKTGMQTHRCHFFTLGCYAALMIKGFKCFKEGHRVFKGWFFRRIKPF